MNDSAARSGNPMPLAVDTGEKSAGGVRSDRISFLGTRKKIIDVCHYFQELL
jgi:hypothetical protein